MGCRSWSETHTRERLQIDTAPTFIRTALLVLLRTEERANRKRGQPPAGVKKAPPLLPSALAQQRPSLSPLPLSRSETTMLFSRSSALAAGSCRPAGSSVQRGVVGRPAGRVQLRATAEAKTEAKKKKRGEFSGL